MAFASYLMGIHDLQSVLPGVSIRRGSFSASVITLVAGTGLAQAFTMVATLILARVFTPADFGILALFLAITSILSSACSWRYEAAIVLPETTDSAVNVMAVAFLILAGMSGLTLLVVALLRQEFALRLGQGPDASWLWGIPINLFLSGFYQILSYWSTRTNHFQSMAIGGFAQAVGAVISQLSFALMGFTGPVSLVSGWIIGQLCGVAVLARSIIKDHIPRSSTMNLASLRAEFVRYKNFPLYNAPHMFAQSFAQQIIIFVLRIFTSVSTVGMFSMARRAVYAPVTLLSSSMRQVFHAKAAVELKDGYLEPFVLKILKFQVLLGTPLLVIFAFEAKPICRLLLGARWTGVSSYASMLALLGYVSFVVTWLERVFDVQGKQHVALVWELSRDALVISGLVVALLLSRNPLVSVGVYVGLDFLCSIVWIILAFNVAHFSLRGLRYVGAMCVGIAAAVAAVMWTARILFHSV